MLEVKDQLVVGGKDGKINIFQMKGKLQLQSSLDLTLYTKSPNYMITSLDYQFNQLLIATGGGDILISEDKEQKQNDQIAELKFTNNYKTIQ